jgi:hypothetical protein
MFSKTESVYFCTYLTEKHDIPTSPDSSFWLVSKNGESVAVEQMFKNKNEAT